ncbi:hypothetical protein PG993_008761 [Apiospora rasikravindrae]|uniref:Uncharacterized protein n=1 Tax=Apiospora rasikravindrae TaxID=990691 RepID=A0ABR1SPC9_9PEZI
MGNGHERQTNEFPVEIMAHIQAGASAEDDARYRNLAQPYLGFEPSREIVGAAPPSSAITDTPVHAPNYTGYIGPTHVGSMSTPPAAQGSAPTQSSVPSVGSRGFFASQPVLSIIEVPQTPLPFSFSQGNTLANQSLSFSSPARPLDNTMTPAHGGWRPTASNEVTHISETPGGSTIIPETPIGQSLPPSSNFQPSSIPSNLSFGSSGTGNSNFPRPVDPAMGTGPSLIYYPPSLAQNYELPLPSGQRLVDDGTVSEPPVSFKEIGSSSPMQIDEEPSSLPVGIPSHFRLSPPHLSNFMELSSSPPNNGGFPSSSPPNDPAAPVIPDTSSQASGASLNTIPLTQLPSSGLFIPETSSFNLSQFLPSSSQSQPMYDPKLEIDGPAPSTPTSRPPSNVLAPNTFITPALRGMQTRLNIDQGAFQPAQSRNLRVDERGYWVVDTSNWTPQQWLGTWAHLTEFIGGGAAGLSVSVRRYEDGATLRVYCFGAMVEHVWWLLFQAAEGGVVASGGRWLDVGGVMVLEIGTRQ